MSITMLFVFILGFIIISGVRIIQQYETGVVFQLGRYSRTLQPGLNLIIPLIETARVIDMRVLTNEIPKQQAITKDNVPVSINGVVYFQVVNSQSAVIEVQNYLYAVSQYAQAALRDVVGGMTFDDLLAERKKIGDEIEAIIQKQAESWGLKVTAIKLLDVDVPEDLKKMMSRQASAEREKRANITKAEGGQASCCQSCRGSKDNGSISGCNAIKNASNHRWPWADRIQYSRSCGSCRYHGLSKSIDSQTHRKETGINILFYVDTTYLHQQRTIA